MPVCWRRGLARGALRKDGRGLIPDQADATIPTEGVTWNYTTYLTIAFLALAAALLWRFFPTGGTAMLRMMGGSPDAGRDHDGHQAHGEHASSPTAPGAPHHDHH